MADREIDPVGIIGSVGDGEQGGDRSGLNHPERVAGPAPFDVLGRSKMRFDSPTQIG